MTKFKVGNLVRINDPESSANGFLATVIDTETCRDWRNGPGVYLKFKQKVAVFRRTSSTGLRMYTKEIGVPESELHLLELVKS